MNELYERAMAELALAHDLADVEWARAILKFETENPEAAKLGDWQYEIGLRLQRNALRKLAA
jgi:hypothetical protein